MLFETVKAVHYARDQKSKENSLDNEVAFHPECLVIKIGSFFSIPEHPDPQDKASGRKDHDARTTDADIQRWRHTFTFTIKVPVAPLTCRSRGPEHLLIRGTTFAPA